uniref:TonB C-terminal domain-containing protein n=1 Tax=Rhodopseudomonas palustris (strain BisA53) TaxID=316055 RepID=Q07MX9_RHOP5
MQPWRSSFVAAAIGISLGLTAAPAIGQEARIDTLKELFATLGRCWRAPALAQGSAGMQITVLVSFRRDGSILGKPKVTFESADASDSDRLAYRVAVMETLQRCTPLPFTEGLAGAMAGRPITMRFDDRRNQPKPKEKQAWLSPKIR